MRTLSRRSRSSSSRSLRQRRLFLESLEPRQMLTSVPVALHDPLYSTAVNTDLVISAASAGIVNNDFDADGNSLSASVVANPASGSLVSFNSNGTFTYRPNTSFTGIDTFTYKVSDGTNDSNVATVSVAVGGNFGPRTNLDESPQNAMLLTGALTLSQPLTLGHELVYRSDTVDPHPVVVLETSLLPSSVPDSIDVRLTFNGTQESTVSYDNTDLAAGDALRFVLQANASTVATGYYDWSITLTAWFDCTPVTRTYTGSQAVVNRSSSEYGKGWWVNGLDQLYATSAGALLVRGNGDTLWFKSDGSGGYLKAPGDTSFSTLVKNGNNTFTLTSKYGQVWDFSTTGLLTSVKDTNDNTVSYTYTDADSDSATDELWKITDLFSRVNTLSYTSGQLTSFQDLASRTTTLSHSSGKLASVTHPDPDAGGSLAAPVTEYQYDATTSLLTIRTDALDYDTTFAYSGTSRRLTSINHPNSTGWSLTAQQTIGLASGTGNTVPDPVDAIGQYVDEGSKTWKFKTDRFGNNTWFKDPLANITTTERDAAGLPIRLTESDPDGAGSQTSPITKFGYSSSGDLVKQYLPDGNDLEWTYNSLHRVLTQTNELNNVWEFTYDTDGNLTAAEDPLGNTTSYTVNSRGQVTQVTAPDPDGAGSLTASSTQYAYSSTTGTLSTITNPGSSTRTFTYNSADLQLTMTDELSHIWTTAYDNLNRVTSQTAPDPDGGGSLTAAVTSFTYNANGWLTEVLDALGNDTDYTYNSRGWVTQVQRPDPDGAGSLTRPTSTSTYNAVGQVTEEGDSGFLSGSIQHTYDDAGRHTGRKGPVSYLAGVEWEYDGLGRLTKETRKVEEGMSSVDRSYVKHEYNARGWVTRTIQSDPANLSQPLVDGPTTTFTYDAAGQLLSTTDARGYVTSQTYDARGLVTKLTQPDPDGSGGGLVSPITTFGYDNAGRQTTVTDPLGRITSHEYDSRNRLTKITQPDPDGAGSATAPITQFAYDNASRRTSVTDPLSRVTSYGYDSANRVLTITAPDPDGAGSLTSPVTTYAYNKLDSVTSVTDPLGNVTSTTYDNLQRQTQVTAPDPDGGGSLTSPVTTYTYNAQGALSKITDPLSRDTTFGYDDFGRQTTVTNHQGKVTTTAYDTLNRVTSVTTPDPDGAGSQTASVTSYAYFRNDQIKQITDPRNGNTSFTYDSLGNTLSLTDASSNDTTWTYDGLSRVTAETNELNKTRTFAYDVAGNLVGKTDRNGRTTRLTYDNLDRLTDEKWYDGAAPTAIVATTTQGGPHDEVQRVGHTGSVYSGTFTLTFDGQTTAAIAFNASAADVRTALEALSNIDSGDITVTKVQDSPGTAHEWQIVFRGSKAGTNVAQITIDISGLFPSPTATQTTDTQGSASNNEVQTVTLSNATGGTFRLTFGPTSSGTEQTADIAYNASAATVETALEALAGIDNVTVTGSAGGPYTITFGGTQANTDVAQLTADITYLTGGTLSRTLSFAYDAASQTTSTSDPDSSYAYTYDNLGRVLTVSNSGTSGVPTVVLTSAYNANSQRTSLAATRGGTNDFLNSYSYDNLNRLTRVEQTGNGGATVANKRVDVTYSAVSQFATIARQVKPSGTWNEVATSTFTYDTLNRITALDHKIGSTDIANYDWTYDAMNRVTQLSNGDGTSDYSYDKESELTATDHSFQTDESYTYDATGNRTNGSYTVGTNNRMTSDGTYNYTYDDEGNRLTRTKISDSSLTEYSWDHRNRLTKVVERATGSGGAITKQSDYKYDIFDRRLSKSYDADGAGSGSAVVSRYVYDGSNIAVQFDGSNNLTHRYLHGPAVDQILADEDSSNNILWPLADNLGTVRDLVNSSGAVQNHLKYDAFGKVTSESNSAIDHIFAYTGRERDEETGLQYHRARYYDPATGRWIGEDPASFAGGDFNLARYVSNDPVNWVDPSGRNATYPPICISWDPGYVAAVEAAQANVHQSPVSGGPLRAGGILNAMEQLGMSEATIAREDVTFAISQVDILPKVTLHPEWSTSQHVTNMAVGAGDAAADLARMTSIIPPNPWVRLVVYPSEVVNHFNPGYIDTSSINYIGGYVWGDTMLGFAMEALTLSNAVANAADVADSVPLVSGGGCFVAGTPVLMADDDLQTNQIVVADDSHTATYGWSVALAGAGLATLAIDLRRRRQRGGQRQAKQGDSDRLRVAGDDPSRGDDAPLDHVFADTSGFTFGPSDCVGEGADRPAVESTQGTSTGLNPRQTNHRRNRACWLSGLGIGLIAAAVLAALLGIRRPELADCVSPIAAIATGNKSLEGHFQAIDQIEVGQRVLGENPTGEFDESLGREVDPTTWRKLTLRADKRDGSHVDVVLLRPNWWIEQRAGEIAGTVLISVPECGIEGYAEVIAIEPCPKIARGAGHIVIGTFHHQSAQVLDLYLQCQAEPIGTTANHLFWSEDRRAFVRAASLQLGERLVGNKGHVRVTDIVWGNEIESVFNIEVLGEHIYCVSARAVIVHNTGSTITGDYHLPGDVPNGYYVVKGGTKPIPTGEEFSGSFGATPGEAGQYVPHPKTQSTTAGQVRSEGGSVEIKPEHVRSPDGSKGPLNPYHVNIVLPSGAPNVFSPPTPKPLISDPILFPKK